MTSFLRSTVEACGFGHHYGGFEGDSRINMKSVDSSGKVWVPEHRHFVKGAVIAALGAAASGVAYGTIQIVAATGL